MPRHLDVRKKLKADVERTRLAYELASEQWTIALQQLPSHIPHPDGAVRARQLGEDFRKALRDYTASVQSLNDFILHGDEPPMGEN